jgi:hypothetical protein
MVTVDVSKTVTFQPYTVTFSCDTLDEGLAFMEMIRSVDRDMCSKNLRRTIDELKDTLKEKGVISK